MRKLNIQTKHSSENKHLFKKLSTIKRIGIMEYILYHRFMVYYNM